MAAASSSPAVDATAPAPQSGLRILLVAPSLRIVGGQSVQATRLFSALAGVPDVEVTYFPINRPVPKVFRWVQRIPLVRTVVNFALFVPGLALAARKHEILHIFTAGLTSYSMWTIPALLIGRAQHKKLIVNYHDGRAEQHLQSWRTAKPTLRWADRIVTPSPYLVDVFAGYDIHAQSIFNLIDVSGFEYKQRRLLRPVFLSNRALEPLYNVECTLRAFQLIQKQYPHAILTVANDGPCRPELERLATELGLRNVTFAGTIPPGEMPRLYSLTDIYLTSSNIDNMPLSILEAFACGVPVVATRAGGIPYIATHRRSALLVDLNDHAAMAAAAIELLENPDLVERITRTAYQELHHYDPVVVRNEWIRLYRELGEDARESAR